MISRRDAFTNCAAAAALSGGLFTLSLVIPAGIMAALLSPLPLALLAWRTNSGLAALTAFIAAGLVAMVSPPEAVSFLAQFGLGAVALGVGVKQSWTPTRTIGGYAAISLLATLALLGVLASSAGQTPVEFIAKVAGDWKAEIDQTLSGELANLPADEAAMLTERLQSASVFVAKSFIGIIAALAILAGWANALFLRGILRKNGAALEEWRLKKLPANLVWLFIAAGALTAAGTDDLRFVGVNLLIAVATAYFFQGIAIIDHLFKTRQTPRFISWPVYAIIILNMPVGPLLVAALGAFDVWFDFRARIIPPPAQTTE